MKQLAVIILAVSAASTAGQACGRMPEACTTGERSADPAPLSGLAAGPPGFDCSYSDSGTASCPSSASQQGRFCEMDILCSCTGCTHHPSMPVAASEDNRGRSPAPGADLDQAAGWDGPTDHGVHEMPSNARIGVLPPDAPIIQSTVLLI